MRPVFDPREIREQFPGLRNSVHLNSASMGVAPLGALRAVESQLRLLESGAQGRRWEDFVAEFDQHVESARREAAKLLGAAAEEVGLVTDTTAGLHHAIEAIPFRAGDNLVVSDLEYPQVPLAAQNAVREHGVEMRFVRHRGGFLSIDDYAAAVDAHTRAILLSSVGWVTGQRLDLAAFSELARRRDCFLVVDAVQQLGGVAFDASHLGIDFAAAGGYKWLNSPFGCGLFYVSRRAHERGLRIRRLGLLGLDSPAGGWDGFYDRPDMEPLPAFPPARSVRRFEAQGTPNRFGAAGLAAALELRNRLAPAESERHILDLGGALIAELRARRAELFTPADDGHRAGIVTFTFGRGPVADKALVSFLESRRIYVSARYCSGVGGVRIAVHFFNSREDVEALLAAVDEFRNRS